MPVKRIVNTSLLVFLEREGLQEILQIAATEVVVPEPVLDEVKKRGPEDVTVRAARDAPWLVVEPVPTAPPEVVA